MLIMKGANEMEKNNKGYTPWHCLDAKISII